MSAFSLPKRPRGRPTAAQNARFDLDLAAWCAAILEINSTLDFRVSSRGWCYILEEKGGLLKGDFDVAQTRINDCRKSGLLPLDICCDDEGRAPDGLEYLDVADVEQEVTNVLDYVANAHHHYNPISFWEAQPKYVEMATEKIDLKSLFSRECNPYHLLISNNSGWNDINSRAAMMRRFANWEAKGKQFVLIYCGDHDPGGLQISGFIHSNFNDLTGAVGWSPDNLIIERFGLDYDFIIAQGLTWIATVRAIERTLRSHGLDWHDIASALADAEAIIASERLSITLEALSRSYDHLVIDAGALPGIAAERFAEFAPRAVLIAGVIDDLAAIEARERLLHAGFTDVSVLASSPSEPAAEAGRAQAAA